MHVLKKLDYEWYQLANCCPYDGCLCLDGWKGDTGLKCWMWIKNQCDLCASVENKQMDLFEDLSVSDGIG